MSARLEVVVVPFGLGAFHLTAWLCFIALLSDRNRPEVVVDWEAGGRNKRGERLGLVIYRDQNFHAWALPFASSDAEEIEALPASAEEQLNLDGPSQWDELEVLR